VVAALALCLGLPLSVGNLHPPPANPKDDPCRNLLSWVRLEHVPYTVIPPRSAWQDPPLAERQHLLWPLVRQISEDEGVDPVLVMALVQVESRFDPWAVSERGAAGLMQITPLTSQELGLDNPLHPEANLRAGIRYLAYLRQTFADEALALAAYNAGPRRVQEAGGAVPDIGQTKDFVSQVQNLKSEFHQRFRTVAQR
jgi:soluble lytic murein transglycosylase-like protein